jgi:hypothetical protein
MFECRATFVGCDDRLIDRRILLRLRLEQQQKSFAKLAKIFTVKRF